jgi:glutamate---cysteine ligase / carboxylate-amine ligase
MNSSEPPLGLFDAHGVEIEYMIVDRETYAVRPIADRVLREGDREVSNFEDGPITWSNELARHVIEVKTTEPAVELESYRQPFQDSVGRIFERLAPLGARLLPGGVHPFMDPSREFERWISDYGEVYAAFDRIFDCKGHGWANLQSVHLNLPFANDADFGRLHAAVRLVLPILPALTASSPFLEGRRAKHLDERLAVYKNNAARVPEIGGAVIPEPAFTEAAYRSMILEPMYRAIAPHDRDGILQEEWLNARGAIARFDRNTIEIRVMDCQEHPGVDLAICAGVTAVVRSLVEEKWSSLQIQQDLAVGPLSTIFMRSVEHAEEARVDDAMYLAALGWRRGPVRARDLWAKLFETTGALDGPWAEPLAAILEQGTLATRLVRALPAEPQREHFVETCAVLSDCLETGRMLST